MIDKGSRRLAHWLPLTVTCTATFLLLVYATIVTVALPAITADLGGGFAAAQWLVDGYLLALAGLLMGMGALGDAIGHRGLFGAATWVFAVATLICGLAPTAGTLVAARVVQGVAAAGLFGTLIPLIAASYRGPERAVAFAVWGSVAGIGGAAGTVVGGIVAQFVSWRWIFLGALPICVAAGLLAALVLPRVPRRDAPLDVPGVVALVAAASAVTFAAITAGERGWADHVTLAALGVGAAALVAFVLVERGSVAPLMPPALMGSRPFAGLLLAAGGYYFAAFGLLPALSLWLQQRAALGALATALVITTQQAGFVAISALAGRRLPGMRMRHTIGVGTVIVGLGDLGLAVGTALPWPALVPGLVVTGIGAGLVSPVLPAAALAAAPEDQAGAASSAANCARQLGLALGIAVLGSTYHRNRDALTPVFVVAAAVALVVGAAAVALLGAGRVAPPASRSSGTTVLSAGSTRRAGCRRGR